LRARLAESAVDHDWTGQAECPGSQSRLADTEAAQTEPRAARRDRTHFLHIAVIVAVVLGVAVGLVFGEDATALKPLGDGFVSLITMMIAPVIFCTLVLGIGSVRAAASVGRVGGLALGYFPWTGRRST
jgi:aerobic C4-dicarboxylate transport protein